MNFSNFCEEDENGAFEWKNGHLTYQESVPTLLQISSFKVAIDIWDGCVSHIIPDETFKNHYNFRCLVSFSAFAFENSKDYFQESKDTATNLKLPKPIEKMIVDHHYLTAIRIERWVMHFIKKVPYLWDSSKHTIFCIDPEWLVWRSNGEIDYHKTVSRMLSSPKLNQVQKFVIMCHFFRIDDIIDFSLSSLPSKFIEEIIFEIHPLIFFWICFLRNELDKIPLGEFPSINVLMARKCRSNIFGFKYFWERLNADEQVIVAMNKLESAGINGYKFIQKFFCKMTQNQQDRLFCEKLALIVVNIWTRLRKPKCAMAIWLHVKDKCTENQFVELVKGMLDTKIIVFEDEMKLFLDLWNSASDHLKMRVTQLASVRSLMNTFCSRQNHSPSSLKFLYEILSMADPVTRENAMEQISTKLPSHFAHSIIMIDVIKLCYPINFERERFLESVLNLKSTQNHGMSLISEGKFDSLCLMLEILSPGINATREFVKRVLEFKGEWIEMDNEEKKKRDERWKFILDHDNWMELSKFVDKTCAADDDPVSALNIKKQFVLSFASAYGSFKHIKGRFRKLTEALEKVLTPKEVELFKKTLLNEFINNIAATNRRDISFEVGNFLEFASWCLGDVKIEDLKGTLPRDKILDSRFKSVCDAFQRSSLSYYFEGLNKWLKFFYNNDEAKNYKVCKIYEFNDGSVLKGLFQQRRSNAKKNFKLVLQHIFENDVEEMKKWQQSKQEISGKRKHSDCDVGLLANAHFRDDAHRDFIIRTRALRSMLADSDSSDYPDSYSDSDDKNNNSDGKYGINNYKYSGGYIEEGSLSF